MANVTSSPQVISPSLYSVQGIPFAFSVWIQSPQLWPTTSRGFSNLFCLPPLLPLHHRYLINSYTLQLSQRSTASALPDPAVVTPLAISGSSPHTHTSHQGQPIHVSLERVLDVQSAMAYGKKVAYPTHLIHKKCRLWFVHCFSGERCESPPGFVCGR